MSGCADYIESEQRAKAVHAMFIRLQGYCPCESEAEVIRLYTFDGLEPADAEEVRTA